MAISKKEQQTIEDYVNSQLEFEYVRSVCKYLDLKYSYGLLDVILDDYNRLVKEQDSYRSKVNALRMFTVRAKYWSSQQYTDYEELG